MGVGRAEAELGQAQQDALGVLRARTFFALDESAFPLALLACLMMVWRQWSAISARRTARREAVERAPARLRAAVAMDSRDAESVRRAQDLLGGPAGSVAGLKVVAGHDRGGSANPLGAGKNCDSPAGLAAVKDVDLVVLALGGDCGADAWAALRPGKGGQPRSRRILCSVENSSWATPAAVAATKAALGDSVFYEETAFLYHPMFQRVLARATQLRGGVSARIVLTSGKLGAPRCLGPAARAAVEMALAKALRLEPGAVSWEERSEGWRPGSLLEVACQDGTISCSNFFGTGADAIHRVSVTRTAGGGSGWTETIKPTGHSAVEHMFQALSLAAH